jgi:hypothetical protein
MTYNEAKTAVAKKHGLGTTLVTGHKAGYFEEAMELYVESLKDEIREAVGYISNMVEFNERANISVHHIHAQEYFSLFTNAKKFVEQKNKQ